MTSHRDTVVTASAVGEQLAELAEHAASCDRCKRAVALPVEIGAVHREADPGLGFTARMTAGTQQRVASRKRRRIATGMAFAVAASTAGVFVMTHHADEVRPKIAVAPPV